MEKADIAERVARAQQLLETTDLSIERITAEIGFGTALSLRQQFSTQLGTSPSSYRRLFRNSVPEGATLIAPAPFKPTVRTPG